MSKLYYDAGPPASGQKVCLATTAYGNLDPGYVFSLQRSRAALADAEIASAYMLLAGNCHVDDARNTVVKEFLLTDCSDLVFLDADVSWDPDQIVDLCRYDCDVVGGVYPYRREGMREAMPVRPLLAEEVIPPNGLVEVEGLPAGFLRIRRPVIERLCESAAQFHGPTDRANPIPVLFERTLEDGIRWGGDLNFCRKWRAEGGHVYAAAEMRLGHAGRSMMVDSLAATARRLTRISLRHVAAAIRAGSETEAHYVEAFDFVGNAWGAPPDVLALAVGLARKADGPIIETGSGLSTVLMAAATDQTVFCLEHDPYHAAKLERMVHEAGVNNIGLCLAPIRNGWYDLSGYPDLPDRFALALNDGPPRVLGDRMKFFDALGDYTDTVLCDDADEPVYLHKLKIWAELRDRTVAVEGRAAVLLPQDCKAVA